MANFQPSASINHEEGRFFNKYYSNYRLLKKDMPNLIELSSDGQIHVTRSRRGQWGEWFEIWEQGKITKQGWM